MKEVSELMFNRRVFLSEVSIGLSSKVENLGNSVRINYSCGCLFSENKSLGYYIDLCPKHKEEFEKWNR